MIVAADEPAAGIDDRARCRQRADDAARRRGHDRELARLDDLAAVRHPDCLARARAEIDERVGDPSALDDRRLARLDYVEACVNETMRLQARSRRS